MPVTHFEFTTIDARRFSRSNEVHRNIQINVHHELTQVIERTQDETEMDFRFAVNYTGMGAVAAIKMEGFLMFKGPGGLAAQWNSQKKLPEEVANEVLNVIMRNCVIEGVVLARDMRLPPPVQLPQVKVGPQGRPPPGSGIEVA